MLHGMPRCRDNIKNFKTAAIVMKTGQKLNITPFEKIPINHQCLK